VVTGRRRVGKTELIRQFLKGRRSCYLYVNQGLGREGLLEDLAAQVERELGAEGLRFTSFAALFRHLLSIPEPIAIAVDEFQRLHAIAPESISELQSVVDLDLPNSPSTLIVSGSSMGMMRRVFEESGSPLFKRAHATIHLRPFSFPEVCGLLGEMGVKGDMAQLDLYCLFGGIPFYYRLLERYDALSLESALDKLILDDLAPLAREPMDVMVEEFGRQQGTYLEILKAMAAGRSARKEIADMTHVEATSLSHYLDDLIGLLGLVEHEVPVTEDREHSRRGRYRISDPFFRFYFRFVWPMMSEVSLGRFERIREEIHAQWPAHRGAVFEDIALQYVRVWKSAEYPEIGRYWSRRGDEVDILLMDRKQEKAMVMEAKAKRLTSQEALGILSRLEDKWKEIPLQGYSSREGIVCFGIAKDTRWPKDAEIITLEELRSPAVS
jgi:AAA+ ATPase superfamily predicted ATPase